MKEKKEELTTLSKYFEEPVVPLSLVCDSIYQWIRCIEEGVKDHPDTFPQGRDYVEHLTHIYTDIRKSGLLLRLIYDQQDVRTEKCIIHQGRMSTGLWVLGGGECCDGSGWIETDPERVKERIEWAKEFYKQYPELLPMDLREKE